VFGKQDNTNTIDLSDIAYGIGGFVINGESAGNQRGYSVSHAGDVNGGGLDDLIVGTNTAKTGKSYVLIFFAEHNIRFTWLKSIVLIARIYSTNN
jgi:hypothetical protein